MGGRAFVAVRVRANELRLYDGAGAPQLLRGGLDAVEPVGAWGGGPGNWDWSAVRGILIK
jgi:hypothetical protein